MHMFPPRKDRTGKESSGLVGSAPSHAVSFHRFVLELVHSEPPRAVKVIFSSSYPMKQTNSKRRNQQDTWSYLIGLRWLSLPIPEPVIYKEDGVNILA